MAPAEEATVTGGNAGGFETSWTGAVNEPSCCLTKDEVDVDVGCVVEFRGRSSATVEVGGNMEEPYVELGGIIARGGAFTLITDILRLRAAGFAF